MSDIEKLEKIQVTETTISLDSDPDHTEHAPKKQTLKYVLAVLLTSIPIAAVLYLNWLDKKYMLHELSRQQLVARLSMYKTKPPMKVFIHFMILLTGVENLVGDQTSQFFTFASIYMITIWTQASLVIVQVVGIISELHVQKEYFWSMTVLSAVFVLIAIGASYSLCKVRGIGLNDTRNGLMLLNMFQAWLTAFGCLFELCQYSTRNLTNMISYYTVLTQTLNQEHIVVTLAVAHVCAMVIGGSLLLTNFLCCLTIERGSKPWIVNQNSSSLKIVAAAFISVSLLHCLQVEWTDLFNSR
ncbi:hypothetical protein OGAPHI_004136 [Ogataea philodendri]|uniref:Uncharacterized protein n=1 Tax=Ogataea philodendri TaxID=1378263 RepID=A0A9P8P626_9ASCO|nr:uncharacterized protein OGAPHI_004136 [Ogataea philodendri]KAH3665947.1 hypothetical protein OGAPHI_004136 [Ogataea philodendri]